MILINVGLTIAENNDPNHEYIFTKGTGKVDVIPNIMDLELGVSTIDLNEVKSIKKTSELTDTILNVLCNNGVDRKDIETKITSISREYKNDRDTTLFVGIKSRNIFKVRLHDVNKAENLLNLLISKGMNILEAYSFLNTEEDSLMRVAAGKAYNDAYKNAKVIAEKSERKIGRLLNASYEKPIDFEVVPDFEIGIIGSRRNLMGGDGGELDLERKRDLKYLKILIPTIHYENIIYTKFELK